MAARQGAPEVPVGEQAPPSAAPVMQLEELPARRPGVVIKILLGLVFLLALAYLAGQRRVQALEQRLGIAQLVTAGFPFVALGLIARTPTVGILTDAILVELSPLLHLGLGWIGISIGFRFDARLLDSLPQGTAPKVAFSTGIPFLTVVAAAGLLLLGEAGWSFSFRDPIFLRDAMILGSAGAITARAAARIISGGGPHEPLVLQIIRLEELAGLAGITLVAAYFRPQDEEVSWRLPGTAWIFITLGLGAAVGLVAYAILRRKATQAESQVLLLGTVAFAAGLASNLLLSPLAVCFVAGVLLVNFPGDYKARVTTTLAQLERPIYLLFLVIVGAIWNVGDWRGWALMIVFLFARFFGKWIGVRLGWSQGELSLSPNERLVLAAAPMGQLSIAIVVSALLLYPQGTVPLIVTAVLGAAIVTEVAVQLIVRQLRSALGPGTGEGSA
ncbi:hypothetical protein [Vulgatibacter sp.]|uniref:hypothetical protein n=1 Tax=Vulgatibacter sp. TaxID=1971226 RepID=UPI003569C81F